MASLAAEDARLAEHVVDEGGLAVVDVGDDGDVADVFAGDHAEADSARKRWAVPQASLRAPRTPPERGRRGLICRGPAGCNERSRYVRAGETDGPPAAAGPQARGTSGALASGAGRAAAREAVLAQEALHPQLDQLAGAPAGRCGCPRAPAAARRRGWRSAICRESHAGVNLSCSPADDERGHVHVRQVIPRACGRPASPACARRPPGPCWPGGRSRGPGRSRRDAARG